MEGSTSATLYRVRSAAGDGVLRVFTQQRWPEPAIALTAREAFVLTELERAPLPTPRLLGTLRGNGVMMSFVPGAIVLPTTPDTRWLEELARTLARIHACPIDTRRPYESWNDTGGKPPPGWWTDVLLWHAAQRLLTEPVDEPPVFLHRDYHPVNVLWHNRRICGVVDWINACNGPAAVDVAHCRGNLAVMYGLEAADAFLAAYQRARPGFAFNPRWDVDGVLDGLPDPQVYPPWRTFGLRSLTTRDVRARLLDLVRCAVRR